MAALKDEKKRPDELLGSADRTVDRRTWMSWLGKATVLSLGGGILAKCTGADEADDGALGGAADSPDGVPGNDTSGMAGSDSAFDTSLDTREDTGDGIEAGEGDDTASSTAVEDDPRPQEDGGLDEALPESCAEPTGSGIVFSPGQEGVLDERWPVRTIENAETLELERILSTWELTVDGMVSSPAVLSFGEVLALPRQNQISDFHCVEGWSVLDVPWNGVHLSEIFKSVQPTPAATHVTFHTMDGIYNESLPIDVALEPMTLLAYGVCEATLPQTHGFPLRIVIPRLLAYKSAKYVVRIELTDHPVEGYWVAAGYDYDGEVPSSRLRAGRY